MKYYFNHYGNVPKELTEAFDNRYTTMRTLCMKYMEKQFSPEYIGRFIAEVRRVPITLYWPELCKVEWTKKDDSNYVSVVRVPKTKEKMSVGVETSESWHIENGMIKEVVKV